MNCRRCTYLGAYLKEKYGIRICDLSHEYSGYKDLNEYLCGKNNQLHI